MSTAAELSPATEPGLALSFDALDRLPTGRDLPSEDGEPMDTWWHRPAMDLLIESIEYHGLGRKDFFVGGNMFVLFSPERVFRKDFRGPDFFVVKGEDHDRVRLSWVAWQEDSRLPDVIIELSSPTTAKTDWGEKKRLYGETMRVAEYYIYDPMESSLVGWRRTKGRSDAPLEIETGNCIWSEELELFIGPWDGMYQGHHNRWLRFFDRQGNLIRVGVEAEAARATAAEAEVARLKVELDRLRSQANPPSP
jgi:Uma2 family endonuclease